MPFRVPLDRPVSSLAAGEKQKLEILKLLYLDQRFLILDEPTSVLTPGEADEILGLLSAMAHRGEITVADDHPQVPRGRGVLRRLQRPQARRQVGGGKVGVLSTREMAAMMIGDAVVRPVARRAARRRPSRPCSRSPACSSKTTRAATPSPASICKVHAGEIVGIAGVSGNGQSRAGRGALRAAADQAARC